MKIQSIVVGLELGHLSDQAVTRAMSLAREFGARLDVVHGAGVEVGHLPRSLFSSFSSAALARALDGARGKLELMVEDPAFAARPVDEYLHVLPSAAPDALLDFAREYEVDLIVLGAHRHDKLLDFGGTGRAVLARSPCPVWVEPAEAQRFERILAPIDLSSYTELVLQSARSLAQRFEVPVRVLHVFQSPVFASEALPSSGAELGLVLEELIESGRAQTHELVRAMDWGALPVEIDFAEGEPAHEIGALAQPTDLVVMGTHGHRGLFRAVLGSCAYRVLKHARGPILVVPQHGPAAR